MRFNISLDFEVGTMIVGNLLAVGNCGVRRDLKVNFIFVERRCFYSVNNFWSR